MFKLAFGCGDLFYLFQDACIREEHPGGFPEIEEMDDYRYGEGSEGPKK